MSKKQAVARPRRRKTEYSLSTSSARISKDTKDRITSQAKYDESFDHTIRRLLGFPEMNGDHA